MIVAFPGILYHFLFHVCVSEGVLLTELYCLINVVVQGPGPEFIKLFTCSTQLSTKFILLINVKMSTTVGILTFISRINDRLL